MIGVWVVWFRWSFDAVIVQELEGAVCSESPPRHSVELLADPAIDPAVLSSPLCLERWHQVEAACEGLEALADDLTTKGFGTEAETLRAMVKIAQNHNDTASTLVKAPSEGRNVAGILRDSIGNDLQEAEILEELADQVEHYSCAILQPAHSAESMEPDDKASQHLLSENQHLRKRCASALFQRLCSEQLMVCTPLVCMC